jgi:hypothetical protein
MFQAKPINVSPSSTKPLTPQQQQLLQAATAVLEVKKVKRKDPITLDLFQALQVRWSLILVFTLFFDLFLPLITCRQFVCLLNISNNIHHAVV